MKHGAACSLIFFPLCLARVNCSRSLVSNQHRDDSIERRIFDTTSSRISISQSLSVLNSIPPHPVNISDNFSNVPSSIIHAKFLRGLRSPDEGLPLSPNLDFISFPPPQPPPPSYCSFPIHPVLLIPIPRPRSSGFEALLLLIEVESVDGLGGSKGSLYE